MRFRMTEVKKAHLLENAILEFIIINTFVLENKWN